ncbi:cocaine- and amphetamine-regulated transcript-like isoform X1 [Hypomesus transpacificus]|uniref:cocaine- and amphetamine-regulated transcript-like isoform X1 n=2 Tax=Hypomesus transpacificus TaxID=137520 RepID=UPI001F07FBDC|nr:cocaine- and amphetamine-regulated transcript-like isoform X1 [Hypomesus transpacificus]
MTRGRESKMYRSVIKQHLRTMDSSGVLRGLLCIGLLSVMCRGQASKEVSSEESDAQTFDAANEKELMDVMETLLGKMNHRFPSTDKRGSIPICGMRDRCAMRQGPRIGKLCDCGRGGNCNSFLLKCI